MRSRFFALAAFLALPGLMAGCASMLLSKHDAPDLHVDRSPAAVKRGEYLVRASACLTCHTPLSAEHMPVEGKAGAGGRLFGKEDGLPGEIYASNLTADDATGLGKWTDGEIVRAIREGVDKQGNPLFPIMPYTNYHEMSDADVGAIVAYLRTLKPIPNEVKPHRLDFPVNMIVYTMPKPVDGAVAAPPADPVKHGQYLFKMASCADCHTPRDNHGAPLPGKFVAGGGSFVVGDGHSVAVPNITQDKQTGIGGWSDQDVSNAVRGGLRPDGKPLMPVMPWPEYGHLSDDDMKALTAYMRTIPPVSNAVKR